MIFGLWNFNSGAQITSSFRKLKAKIAHLGPRIEAFALSKAFSPKSWDLLTFERRFHLSINLRSQCILEVSYSMKCLCSFNRIAVRSQRIAYELSECRKRSHKLYCTDLAKQRRPHKSHGIFWGPCLTPKLLWTRYHSKRRLEGRSESFGSRNSPKSIAFTGFWRDLRSPCQGLEFERIVMPT